MKGKWLTQCNIHCILNTTFNIREVHLSYPLEKQMILMSLQSFKHIFGSGKFCWCSLKTEKHKPLVHVPALIFLGNFWFVLQRIKLEKMWGYSVSSKSKIKVTLRELQRRLHWFTTLCLLYNCSRSSFLAKTKKCRSYPNFIITWLTDGKIFNPSHCCVGWKYPSYILISMSYYVYVLRLTTSYWNVSNLKSNLSFLVFWK